MANEETTQDQITDLSLTTGDPGAAEAVDANASAVVDDELDLDDEPSARVDEELASAQNDEEREAVRERRRAERQARRKHARERREQLEQTVARLERQNSELRQQQEVILSTQHSAQISQLDAAINEAKALAKQYEDIAADAVSKQDGRTTMEATRRMTLAQERARQLIEYKNRASAATHRRTNGRDRHRRSGTRRAPAPAFPGPRRENPAAGTATRATDDRARKRTYQDADPEPRRFPSTLPPQNGRPRIAAGGHVITAPDW